MPKYTTGTFNEMGLRSFAEVVRGIAGKIDGLAEGLKRHELDEVAVRGEADRRIAIEKLLGWCAFGDEAINSMREGRGDFACRVSDVSESSQQSPEKQDLSSKAVKHSRGTRTKKG
jgi:hypothetical protein